MALMLSGTQPILCANTIRRVDQELIALLESLGLAEWELPTIVPQWIVRDVVAHLLDTALRKLSGRDLSFVETAEVSSNQNLALLVNRLNREGVTVYRRLSPRVLIELMKLACNRTAELYELLDPFADAAFGVSWAGEKVSQTWFDTARELTERWHHQQQIRLATERPGIMVRELYYPVLDTFLRGLPYCYRDVDAAPGTAVLVEVSGDCGGLWCLVKSAQGWGFAGELPTSIAAEITIPQSIAWRIFTKGIDRESAQAQATIAGDRRLAQHVLHLVAIVG